MNKFVFILFLFFITQEQIPNSNKISDFETEKICGKISKYSYSFGIKIKRGQYSLIIKTESYLEKKIKDNRFDFNEPILNQKLYFLYKQDTIKVRVIDSRKGLLRLKGYNKEFVYFKNQIKFFTVIEGEKEFFYYVTGGEDCVSGCPEFYAFYDKKGNVLWKSYIKNEGSYSRTLNSFNVKERVYNKNSIKLVRVTPFKEIGATINSSLIKL